MEPSWTSPIPQAMQQHRGSQEHKPAPAVPDEAVRPSTNAAQPDDGSPKQSGRGTRELE